MVTFCCLTRYASNQKASENWLKSHGVDYKKILFSEMSDFDFKLLLSKTDNGLYDIIKGSSAGTLFLEKITKENLNLTECVDLIRKNPKYLKSPLLFDDKHFLSGYDENEIRMFVSRDVRNNWITSKLIA